MEIENSSERLIWRKKKYSVVFCLRGKNQMVQQKQYYCFLDSNKLMVRCWPQNFVLFSHVFSINFDLPMKFSFRPYKFDQFKQSKHLFSYLAVDKSGIIYCKTYFINFSKTNLYKMNLYWKTDDFSTKPISLLFSLILLKFQA